MKKSIAIDMDGVLADVERHFFDWYHRDYGIRFTRQDVLGKDERTAFPDPDAVMRFVYTPGFFRSLPVMADAVESVKELMKEYEVYIVSAAMEFPLSLPEKLDWLKEHFPFIGWRNIIFCGDKSIINVDYMIDDHCKNLDFCKGKTIMFAAYHNAAHTHHQRAEDWKEVMALFKKEVEAK